MKFKDGDIILYVGHCEDEGIVYKGNDILAVMKIENSNGERNYHCLSSEHEEHWTTNSYYSKIHGAMYENYLGMSNLKVRKATKEEKIKILAEVL